MSALELVDYVFRAGRRLEHEERRELGGITIMPSWPFDDVFVRWWQMSFGNDADVYVLDAKHGKRRAVPHGPDAWDIVLDLGAAA